MLVPSTDPVSTAYNVFSIAKTAFSLSSLFGSKKTPAVLQGFDVEGTLDKDGLRVSSVTAFSQKGDRWAATGELAYLNSLGRSLFVKPLSGIENTSTAVKDDQFDKFIARHGAQRISLKLPPKDYHVALADTINAGIRDFVGQQDSTTMNAADFSGSTGTDVPGVTAAPPTTVSVPAADPLAAYSSHDFLKIALILGSLYFLA